MSTDLARLIADTTRSRDESLTSLASHLRLAQMEAHIARIRSEQLGASGGALRDLANRIGDMLAEIEAAPSPRLDAVGSASGVQRSEVA